MLEIGPRLAVNITYEEAVMLAFCKGEGWRLPTWDEWLDDGMLENCWFVGRSNEYNNKLNVRLVRESDYA